MNWADSKLQIEGGSEEHDRCREIACNESKVNKIRLEMAEEDSVVSPIWARSEPSILTVWVLLRDCGVEKKDAVDQNRRMQTHGICSKFH